MSKENRRTIKVGIFTRTHYQGTTYLEHLPRPGDYLQLFNQKYTAWQIEAVIHTANEYQIWDIVVVLASQALTELDKELFEKTVKDIERERMQHFRAIRQDRQRYNHPTKTGQRSKEIYQRVKAGESLDSIAAEQETTPARIKTMLAQWKNLLVRLRLYKEVEIGGEKFVEKENQ